MKKLIKMTQVLMALALITLEVIVLCVVKNMLQLQRCLLVNEIQGNII